MEAAIMEAHGFTLVRGGGSVRTWAKPGVDVEGAFRVRRVLEKGACGVRMWFDHERNRTRLTVKDWR